MATPRIRAAHDLGKFCEKIHAQHLGAFWPSPKWRDDPLGFAHTILGVDVTTWEFQRDFLLAITKHRHVAVAGGRKIGKDFTIAVAALWWFCTFPNARVFLLAPSGKQLDGIAYREIKILIRNSGRCLDCKKANPIGPTPCPHSQVITADHIGVNATKGIRANDFREIVGQTAVDEGGLRGMSGARILAIEDEASDIKDDFDTALVGNLAGENCTRVMISNPTKTSGFFHKAFHEERDIFFTMNVDTQKNPNIVEGREVIPGLATRQWLIEREIAWGKGSSHWLAHVEGKFVKAEKGQLFSLEAIAEMEHRWEHADTDGRLQIGIDPAGEGQDGDETAFAVRRGRKVLTVEAYRGWSPDRILVHVQALLKKYRKNEDREEDLPIVTVDRDGHIGARVYDAINAYHKRDDKTQELFRIIGFRGSEPPKGRLAEIYHRSRDALFGGLVDAFRDGLGIPQDTKLEGELVKLKWVDAERGRSQLMK